ncbi:hypothetical protein JRQ81_018786 [Phrynocephalus forsythii]|uniref:COX assembly mitochondrial protein n=1 Tax=Phrynocephalus forsythii TaxID=171643 RepID=A0A9Q0XR54_9SAUR|nr:hypothetical protein JRQ81_018786 [Phrynocephalus forsythii]
MAATREEEEDRILEEKRKKLRRLEKNTLIMDIMKEKAVKLCSEQMNDFNACCKEAGFLMAFTCRKESKELKACFNRYYYDPTFVRESEIEYLRKKNK